MTPLASQHVSRTLGLLLVTAAAALSAFVSPAQAADTVLWNGDFESGGLPRGSITGGGTTSSQYSSIQEMGGAGVVSLASTPTRTALSTRSAKVHMPAGSQRSQLVSNYKWNPDSTGSTDQWYGASFYVGQEWDLNQVNTSSSQFFNPIAWRCQCPNGSLNVDGHSGHLWLRRNTLFTWPDGQGTDLMDLGPLVKGTWIDLVFHIRWSTTEVGAVREAWRDGVFMGRKTNRNSVDTSDHYYRVGVYQGTGVTQDRDLWIDNVKIGGSYAAVNPSGTASSAAPALDVTAPSVPGGLRSVSIGTTSATLAWNPSADDVGVAAYRITRDGNVVATTTTTQYVDSSLAAGRQYVYTVSAVDAAGNVSGASAPLSVITTSVTSTSAGTAGTPTFIAASNGTGNAAEATALSFAIPAGLANGDVVLASVATRGNPVLTAPAGWTKVASADSPNVLHEAVYMHRCESTCSAGRVFTWNMSLPGAVSGSLAGYRGVSATTPVDMSASRVNAPSTASTAPSVTASAAGDRIVLLHASASASAFTAAVGTSYKASSIDPAGTYRSSTGISDDISLQAGTTAERIAHFAAATLNAGITVALRGA